MLLIISSIIILDFKPQSLGGRHLPGVGDLVLISVA